MKNFDFIVVDTETTGITNKDRIIEISALTLDSRTLEIVDEFDTLINPLRDISNSHIHGITAEMVSSAPTFEEISIYLANILEGKIFVAHNIAFDQRMLKNEFIKLGIEIDFGVGLCTLRQSNQKLNVACSQRNINLDHAHRALSDARATAKLASHFVDEKLPLSPISLRSISGESNPRTFRRDHFNISNQMPTVRRLRSLRFPTSDENEIAYLDVLDHLFEDSQLTEDEIQFLENFAASLGISEWSRRFLNKEYLNSFVIAAKRDEIFSEQEQSTINHLVDKLQITDFKMPEVKSIQSKNLDGTIKVCFTGEAYFQGSNLPREKLEAIASFAGMTCVNSVTKKNCTLVVAASVHTMSGKAKKARSFEIPVISIEEFFEMDAVKSVLHQSMSRPDW